MSYKNKTKEDTPSLDAVWFLDVTITPVDLCQKQSTPGRGTNWRHRLTNPRPAWMTRSTQKQSMSECDKCKNARTRKTFKFEDSGVGRFQGVVCTVCEQAGVALW